MTKAKKGESNEVRYDIAITALYQNLQAREASNPGLEYTGQELSVLLDELLKAGKISKRVANEADIKYTFDARRDFPAAIAAGGHWAIVGRGKGKYRFVKMPHNNLIRIPNDLPVELEEIQKSDETPLLVKRVTSQDEQATMAKVRHNHIVQHFTGMATVYHLQGHERTAVPAGQIEVDEVYGGEDGKGTQYVMPLSAKGGTDLLSYTQALNLNLYVEHNAQSDVKLKRRGRYAGLIGKPLGAVRVADGSIVMLEFSTETDVTKIRIVRACRYTLL